MPSPEPIQGIMLPDPTDAPDMVTDLRRAVEGVLGVSVPRFSSTAQRDTAIPSPEDGQMCWAANRCYVAFGGSWVVAWQDTGEQPLDLASGFSGSAQWRATAQEVTLTFDISGTVVNDTMLTAPILTSYRPAGALTLVPATTYVDPAGARPTAEVYFSGASGVLRATAGGGPDMTRVRGTVRWGIA